MDLSMELGIDFVQHIDKAVGSCRLLVAVIGPRWATTKAPTARADSMTPRTSSASKSKLG